ncbi:MSCRAMM family protein [Fundicoccus ignavus]|nr:carboxypeptidase regulatory-like domain-containing protein [Fundicoccus ignavus]
MKIKQRVSHVLLALMLVLASVPLGTTSAVSAQEEMINVVFKVFLQLEGQEANEQGQISYDVLNSDKTEYLYQYRSQEPPAESLQLAEGNYYFRLYDGGGFTRDGVEILPEKVLQTISNQTDEDKAEDKTERSLEEVGQVVTQGDGTKVYEVPFSVFAGPTLVNGDTVEIKIHLADQASIDTNKNEEQPETPETDPAVGSILFTVLDQEGVAVPGVGISVAENELITSDTGEASIGDLPVQDYTYRVTSLPEGYSGATEGVVTLSGDQQVAPVIYITKDAPQVGDVRFEVKDQNETAFANVTLVIEGQEVTTDENGVAIVTGLPLGTFNYSVAGTAAYSETYGEVTVGEGEMLEPVIVNRIAQKANATFTVVDGDGTAVAGAVINIDDQQITTNEEGYASIELALGDYEYSLADLPEGYSGEASGLVTVGSEGTSTTIEITKEAQQGTVLFDVHDQNGAPVEAVTLTIEGQEVTTNSEGQVVTAEFPVGTLTYAVPGTEAYGETYGEVTVSAGEQVTETVLVNLVPDTGNVTFKVLDDAGAAVVGAVINIAEQQITTNEEGSASLTDLPVGDYSYSITSLPEGYTGTAEGTVTVSTEAGEAISLAVEKAPEVGTAAIKVVDQNEAAVVGAVILVGEQEYTTNEEGRAVIEGLLVGEHTYQLTTLPDGYSIEEGAGTGTVNVTTSETASATITVTKVPQVGSASIKVIDQNESAVEGAVITVAEQEFTTNAEGVAAISELSVGDKTYTLTSLPEGYSGEESGTLTVVANETASATITVTKAPQVGSASIKVIDQNESAVEGAIITVAEQEFTTNAEGVAAISELSVGDKTYTLTRLPEGYSGEGSGTFTVVANETASATITVTKAPQVGSASIKVIDQNEAAVEGAVITVAEQEFTTNAEGVAAISELSVGDKTYTLTSLPEGYSGEGSGSFTVVANETAGATITVTKAPQTGTASFTVVDQNDTKIEGIVVTINEQTATTNAEGVAQIADLAAGDYTYSITTLPEGYSGDVSGTLTIVAGETASETLSITRDPRYGNVTLTVKDQEDKAVVGAVIRLNEQEFTTNENGEAIILELQAGKDYTYQLVSLPEAYSGEAEGTVTINQDETAQAAITVNRIVAKGQLTVVVKDQTEAPVEGAVIQLVEGTEATTNAEGQAVFNEIAPKTYNVTIKQLPDRYSHELGARELGAREVVIAEGASETLALNVQRAITKRAITLRVLDQEDKAVENATVVLNEQTQTTNAEGRVAFKDLTPKVYTYQITELPEGYQGAHEGEVTLTEAEDLAQDIRVERIIEPGTATITVVNQDDGQPVENATVKFGGLTQTTDSSGQTTFTSLEPGNYYYMVTEVPTTYQLIEGAEEQRAEIAEAQNFEATLEVDKKPEVGQIDIKIVNTANQAIEGVTIKIGDQEVTTNAQGVASFTNLAPGDYTFEATKAPEGYLLETVNATITVQASQTVTQSFVLEKEAEESSSETSEESEESEPDESEVEQATQRFVDEATGVEVLVNPADAGNIVKLQVTKVPLPLNPEPAALRNMNADVYQVTLIGKDNQPVQLTRVAQVKLPTQPVTSQLRVLRVSGENTSSLTFSLFNQKVNFSTQELGQFAIVYGAKAAESESSSESETTSESSDSTTVSVSKTTDVEQNLPNTGEIKNLWYITLGILLALLGVLLVIRNRKAE